MQEMAAEVRTFEAQVLSRGEKAKQSVRPLTSDDRKEMLRQIKDASMDEESHTRMLQKKLAPVELKERQTHQYLDRIRVP